MSLVGDSSRGRETVSVERTVLDGSSTSVTPKSREGLLFVRESPTPFPRPEKIRVTTDTRLARFVLPDQWNSSPELLSSRQVETTTVCRPRHQGSLRDRLKTGPHRDHSVYSSLTTNLSYTSDPPEILHTKNDKELARGGAAVHV